MRKVFLVLSLLVCHSLFGQDQKTRNLIIITLDGFRWQELFEGADQRIILNDRYVDDANAIQRFQGVSHEERRQKLMPFFWNVIAKEGQLYGNRNLGNKVNCKNWHLLSYPGYSEMLVGFVDRKVSSNDKRTNPNSTVLEFVNSHESFHQRVAAFATWDVFPYILREKESSIYVNAGNELAQGNLTVQEQWMNDHNDQLKKENGSRYDEFTFHYALQYLTRERPRLMFIGFDETDAHAHGGDYDGYLKAAHHADKMIRQLWNWIQSQPDYKDQTTLLITTDHGRGNGKNTWKNHRLLATGSRHIWFAVLGPDTPSFGEMNLKTTFYQKQVAKTVAAFLGLPYVHRKPVGDVVQTMLAIPPVDLPENVETSSLKMHK